MLGAVEWSNLTIAGAFIVGAALGTLATIRVTRAVLTMFERRPQFRARDDD